eukprot:m.14579 g.14579  ORF g.14579 m.14579 type:complete len:80 (+) comp10313_c0_seq1:87-326(+)
MFSSIPTHMDFAGQALAEKLYQYIIAAFTFIGFFWGLWCEQFGQTVYVAGAGVFLASLLCLPPWGFYRRQPVKWLQREA